MTASYPAVRARVPLRLGLAGGGTDLSPYCDEFGGAVLNTTVDRYAYAFMEPSATASCTSCAPDLEIEESLPPELDALAGAKLSPACGRDPADDPPVCAAASSRRCASPSFVDAPPGPGWARRRALVVALVEAFRPAGACRSGRYDVAHLAFEIERLELKLAGGKQDQYAGAFGGVNFLEFLANDRVIVNPLRVGTPTVLNELQTSWSSASPAYRAGPRRSSRTSSGACSQPGDDGAGQPAPAEGGRARDEGGAVARQIPRMAEILNRSWEAKQKTAAGGSAPADRAAVRRRAWRTARSAARCRARAAAGS